MRLIGFCALGLVVALVSGSSAPVNAQDLLVNDWGTPGDLQSWRKDFGDAATAPTQDPSEGSPGNAAGALRLDMTFSNNSGAYTGDLFFPATDLSQYTEVLFDLMIDPNSAQDAFGNYGYMQFVSRETDSYSFNSVLGENLTPATGWRTFSAPADTMTATRAFTLQLYGGPAQNLSGNVTLWLDNIRLVGQVPEPGSMALGMLAVTAVSFRRRRQPAA